MRPPAARPSTPVFAVPGDAPPPAGGYFTPSLLMGAEYVLTLPGVRLIEEAA